MSDYANDDPTGPATVADAEGGYGDSNTDLMRPDSDPRPDSQVPGASPDGQAPTTPEV
jgi:hypothetical protein